MRDFIVESSDNPFVVEAAFAVREGAAGRGILAGVNFSPAIGNPFQVLGRCGGLHDVLAERSCGSLAPIVFFLHYVSPHTAFTDRGKAALVLPAAHADAVVETVGKVTAAWHKKHRATARAEQLDRKRVMQEIERRQRDAAARERAARAEERAARSVARQTRSAVVGSGALYHEIAEAASGGQSLKALTVLSPARDPYRLDTVAGHEAGKWFAEQLARFVSIGTVHLRGLHYRLVAAGDVRRPDGNRSLYVNSELDWRWLSETAAKAARWLGYVPLDRIRDERNEAPEIRPAAPKQSKHSVGLSSGDRFVAAGPFSPGSIPALASALPRLLCFGGFVPQPNRIIFFGEKASLRDTLLRIAQRVGGELILSSSELSDTLLAEMAARAAEDGRPAVVLYFADFDPSGWQMPISVSRKLQALRTLKLPDLQIELYRVALTLDQVRHFNLLSTPLKKTERRGNRWRTVMQHEQTEIDALAALRPGDLERIALDAIKPFYDETLRDRCQRAAGDWEYQARELVPSHPEYAAAKAEIGAALRGVTAAADEWMAALDERTAALTAAAEGLQQAQERALTSLADIELPPAPEPPKPEFTAEAPMPLFTTDDDFVTATRKLIASKALELDGDEP